MLRSLFRTVLEVSKEGDASTSLGNLNVHIYFQSLIVLFLFFKTYANMRLLRHLKSYESVSEGKGILIGTERRKPVTSHLSHYLPTLRDISTFLMECRGLFC